MPPADFIGLCILFGMAGWVGAVALFGSSKIKEPDDD
jgi:hypothetical protein